MAVSNAADTRRPQHSIFKFTYAKLRGRSLLLGYELAGGPDADIAFEELIVFPADIPAPDPTDQIVQSIVDGCHRAFGVTYFKAAVPARIEASPVNDEDADFWDFLYSEGLGEFYYRNGLSPHRAPRFPRSSVAASCKGDVVPVRPDSALVLIGGGKDSALVAEIVRCSGVPAAALSLGDSPWAHRSAAASRLPLHVVQRTIDHQLFAINARGAWNGHIPISACIAFVSLLTAYAGGFANVLVGNERGAEEHNLECDGIAINHQWSKTLRFEMAFRRWCMRRFNQVQGPSYFSLLRPMSEIHIAQRFALLSDHLQNFTSCNINFRQTHNNPEHRWCGQCPKCVFVYLLLAPHLNEKQTRLVFGSNFFANEINCSIIEALLGVRDTKPWECVGTIRECRLSYTALFNQNRLPENVISIALRHPQVLCGDNFETQWREEFILSKDHCLPQIWMERLNAYICCPR